MWAVVPLKRVFDAAQPLSSLSQDLGEDEDRTLDEIFDLKPCSDPSAELDAAECGSRVEAALDRLGFREKEILKSRYGIGRPQPATLREVAAKLKISRERVRQIESEALEKLRRNTSLSRSLKGLLE